MKNKILKLFKGLTYEEKIAKIEHYAAEGNLDKVVKYMNKLSVSELNQPIHIVDTDYPLIIDIVETTPANFYSYFTLINKYMDCGGDINATINNEDDNLCVRDILEAKNYTTVVDYIDYTNGLVDLYTTDSV